MATSLEARPHTMATWTNHLGEVTESEVIAFISSKGKGYTIVHYWRTMEPKIVRDEDVTSYRVVEAA